MEVTVAVYVLILLVQMTCCCPIALEEGNLFNVNCLIPTNIEPSNTRWMITYSDGSRSSALPLACGDGDAHDCPGTDGATIKTQTTDYGVDSNLYINVTSSKHRGAHVTCGVWNDTALEFNGQLIVDCRISAYLPPQNPQCKVEKTNSHTVLVECAVDEIYPDLFCDISQVYINENKRYEIPGNDIKYVNNDISGKSSCSATINLPLRGEYTFWLVLYPDVGPLSRLRKTFMTMSRIQQLQRDGTPYRKLRKDIGELQKPLFVTIETSIVTTVLEVQTPEENVMCDRSKRDTHGGDTVRAKCIANGLTSPPTFQWRLNGDIVEPLNVAYNDIRKTYTSTVSINTLFLKNPQGNDISCLSLPSDDQPFRMDDVRESKHIELKWPPEENPKFLGNDIELSELTLPVGEDINLMCSVPGGNPRVKSTRVKCWGLEFDPVSSESRLSPRAVAYNTFDVSLDQSQPNDKLWFKIKANASRGGCRCECSAEHETGCYTKQGHLEVTFVEEVSPSFLAQESSDIIKFVIIGFGCVFLLSVFMFIVFAFMKRSKQSHDDKHIYEDPEEYLKTQVSNSGMPKMPTTTIKERGKTKNQISNKHRTVSENSQDKRKSRLSSTNDHGYGSQIDLLDGGYLVPLYDAGCGNQGTGRTLHLTRPEPDSDGDSVIDEPTYSEVSDLQSTWQARVVDTHQDTLRHSMVFKPHFNQGHNDNIMHFGDVGDQRFNPPLVNMKTARI